MQIRHKTPEIGRNSLPGTMQPVQHRTVVYRQKMPIQQLKKADTPVKTADTANIWTCLLLMASSAATAAGIGAKRLNKNKNKQ